VPPDTRGADGGLVRPEQVDDSERELRASIACDAQTSGGRLLCVPAESADALVAELRGANLPAARIGTLSDGQSITLA